MALVTLATSKGDLETAGEALAELRERRRERAGVVSIDPKRRAR